jgi:glutamate--cysteine ligase
MMSTTAATQVNLDVGPDAVSRWQLLHDLGPVLVAAFANSPFRAGRPTGWKSSRQQIWQALDPTRTAVPTGDDPVDAYATMALDAAVMLEPDRGTFRAWVESDDPPTESDLALHLTTLFPPVRPRGWFEVRYLDAQSLRWWPVPVAVLAALADDPTVAETAAAEAAPARGLWREAARLGLEHPVLRAVAPRLFALAVESLGSTDPLLVDLVRGFAQEYVEQGRCPADDRAVSEVS